MMMADWRYTHPDFSKVDGGREASGAKVSSRDQEFIAVFENGELESIKQFA